MTTKNSTLVTNYEAGDLSPACELGGKLRVAQGTIALATTDIDASDVVMLAPVPSNASITSIKLASDNLDSNNTPTLAFHVGLHGTDGTAADADCFATAITLGQAATVFTEYAFEARNINETGQLAWEDAAASSDPGGFYYVSMTVSNAAATAAAGDVAFIIEYVVN